MPDPKPSEPLSLLFSFSGTSAYRRYLDRLIKELELAPGDYLRLAEVILNRAGFAAGIKAPPRTTGRTGGARPGAGRKLKPKPAKEGGS